MIRPAEVFSASEYVMDEIKARKWTITKFAKNAGLKRKQAVAFLKGYQPVNGKIASGLARAFKTGETYWTNIQKSWDEFK